MAEIKINPKYPDIHFLRARAKQRIPRFAFEYLDGGCNSEVNLKRNTAEIREVRLKPYYLRDYGGIHTCLLYTSPSPRDQRGSRMPSSA